MKILKPIAFKRLRDTNTAGNFTIKCETNIPNKTKRYLGLEHSSYTCVHCKKTTYSIDDIKKHMKDQCTELKKGRNT